MPSRVGALPHPSPQHDNSKKTGGRGNGGGKQQGITMQDLKKQTAMRLMAQQQEESRLIGYESHSRSTTRPKQNVSSHRVIATNQGPSLAPVVLSPHRPQTSNSGGSRRGNNNRKPNSRRSDSDAAKDDGSSSTSAGSSVYSGQTPNRRGGGGSSGQGNRNNHNNGKDQQRKLPHGLTVQELKELTAARLARESAGTAEAGSTSGKVHNHQNQPHRVKTNVLRPTGVKPVLSPYHDVSSFRQTGTPSRNESPVSLPTFQGHAPSFGTNQQHILQPVPQNRFEQSPNTLPAGHYQHMMSPRMMESPARPDEIVHLRSRHCSVDSVSTLGSEYLASSDPKSPFPAPFRANSFGVTSGGNDGLNKNFQNSNVGHMQDALGRALSLERERALSQDQGSFELQQQGGRSSKGGGYDILMSPNSAFSERNDSRNQYLNSPFWALHEDRPSTDEVAHVYSTEEMTRTPFSKDHGSGLEAYPHESLSLNGLEGFHQGGKNHEQPHYMASLSMPDNLYDDRDFLPSVPPPMPRQQSESDHLPKWVAESVLVTPQTVDERKVSLGKKVSGAAAWPESANKAADIFRPAKEIHDDEPVSRVPTASTWTCSSPGSSSGVGTIGNRAPPSSSLSFGGVDALTEGLGAILNFNKQESAESSGLSEGLFQRSEDPMFSPLAQTSSSMEGHVSLSENEASLSNSMFDKKASASSLWGWTLGLKKEE